MVPCPTATVRFPPGVLAVIACGVGMLVNRDTPETYHFFAMALAFNGCGGWVLLRMGNNVHPFTVVVHHITSFKVGGKLLR